MNPTKPIKVSKSVKHVFTTDERNAYQSDLLSALQQRDTSQAEFDSIKATYKARITEAESRVTSLAATLRAGWEMRVKSVAVVFHPKEGKKRFHLFTDLIDGAVELHPHFEEADMTAEDYTMELFEAEKIFSSQANIQLWNAGKDVGMLVLGKLADKWYGAVRGNIGRLTIVERLDSMQRAFKSREDCVITTAARAYEWLDKNLSKDTAKGFREAIEKAVIAQKGKVE